MANHTNNFKTQPSSDTDTYHQIATLLPEMKRTGAKKAVVSMCIGTGMGAAALIENEQ
jgi:hypothetical protein